MTYRGDYPRQSGGYCRHCGRSTGGLKLHERACGRTHNREARAVAHQLPLASAKPHPWLGHVTDEDMAVLMYAIEAGALLQHDQDGRWTFSSMDVDYAVQLGHDVSLVVGEAIRTGLLRHLRRSLPDGEVHLLIPAPVHYRNPATGRSACQMTGEGMGPMRVRLLDDLALADCLMCESAVAPRHSRQL